MKMNMFMSGIIPVYYARRETGPFPASLCSSSGSFLLFNRANGTFVDLNCMCVCSRLFKNLVRCLAVNCS